MDLASIRKFACLAVGGLTASTFERARLWNSSLITRELFAGGSGKLQDTVTS